MCYSHPCSPSIAFCSLLHFLISSIFSTVVHFASTRVSTGQLETGEAAGACLTSSATTECKGSDQFLMCQWRPSKAICFRHQVNANNSRAQTLSSIKVWRSDLHNFILILCCYRVTLVSIWTETQKHPRWEARSRVLCWSEAQIQPRQFCSRMPFLIMLLVSVSFECRQQLYWGGCAIVEW